MENNTPNNTQDNTGDALPPTQKSPAPKPRKKRMTEAALAANRRNDQKSTGPRTDAGKARSASNAFQHGLYSMKNYRHLVTHPNRVAITVHNLLEEYQPVTPTDHMLLQQFIHFELRFLQMEHVCNHYMLDGKHDAPDRAYLTVLRELDRIPNRILKTIKALKALIAERGIKKEIEPIDDPPPVPTPDEYAKTNEEYAKTRNKAIHPLAPKSPKTSLSTSTRNSAKPSTSHSSPLTRNSIQQKTPARHRRSKKPEDRTHRQRSTGH